CVAVALSGGWFYRRNLRFLGGVPSVRSSASELPRARYPPGHVHGLRSPRVAARLRSVGADGIHHGSRRRYDTRTGAKSRGGRVPLQAVRRPVADLGRRAGARPTLILASRRLVGAPSS